MANIFVKIISEPVHHVESVGKKETQSKSSLSISTHSVHNVRSCWPDRCDRFCIVRVSHPSPITVGLLLCPLAPNPGLSGLKFTLQPIKFNTTVCTGGCFIEFVMFQMHVREFFTNTQNRQKWQYWHHRLFCVKTKKNPETKCYPTEHWTHCLNHSGLMLSSLSHWGKCYLAELRSHVWSCFNMVQEQKRI